MVKSTSLLDRVEVAAPCPADWDKMAGDERKRFCDECQLHVFNLSSMTKQEAEDFLISSMGQERTCIRFYRRADGTILTENCPRGLRRLRDAARRTAALVSGFLSLVFTAVCGQACAQEADSSVKGKVAPRSTPENAAIAGGLSVRTEDMRGWNTGGAPAIGPDRRLFPAFPSVPIRVTPGQPRRVPALMPIPVQPNLHVSAKVVVSDDMKVKHHQALNTALFAVNSKSLSWQINSGMLKSSADQFAGQVQKAMSLGQPAEVAMALNNQANCLYYQGQFKQACALYDQAMKLIEEPTFVGKPALQAKLAANLKQAEFFFGSTVQNDFLSHVTMDGNSNMVWFDTLEKAESTPCFSHK